LLWREDGLHTIVSIQRDPSGNLTMYLDGSHNTGGRVRLHSLIGRLPLVLHDNPREALVIGLGGGVTARSRQSALRCGWFDSLARLYTAKLQEMAR
jgi:spermidine synthase